VLPTGLAVVYPLPIEAPPLWQPLLALGLLSGATVAVVWLGRRRPYLPVGWLWYLGTLVPVIGLVQVGFQARADRYTYLPTIGLAIMLAWTLAEARLRATWLAGAAMVVLAALVLATRGQVVHWRDSFALYERALSVTTGNYVVHANLGSLLVDHDRHEEARSHWRAALESDPRYLPAHYNLGVSLARGRDKEGAVVHFRAALDRDPDHVEARYNLALVLSDLGRVDEARQHYEKVIEASPDQFAAHHNLANLLRSQGRLDEAIAHYERAAALRPDHPVIHYNWGRALEMRGDLDAAGERYDEARRLRGR
jgi:tetratricopeptide (TPR) repeat protein